MTKKMRNTFITAFTMLALGTGMLACGAMNNVSASAETPASDFRMACATVKLFEMVEGQDDNSAIRFRIQMSDAKYATVYAENSTYSVGALLLPADCTTETTLTKETVVTKAGASIYEQAILAEDWVASKENTGYKETYVDLYNFPREDYNRVILATGYIYDGTDYTYTYEYAADGETKENVTLDRSMAQVANAAINDTSATAPSDEQKALAENYILTYAVNYVDAETRDTILTSSAKYGETVTVPNHTENAEITGAYVDQAKTTPFAGEIKGTTTIYTTGTYFTGEGTKTSPYVMDTAEEVFLFAKQINENGYTYEGKYLKTTKNIDLGADSVWTPIEAGFKGTFDGRSKTISNVNINATEDTTGFFRFLSGATIKNLKLSVNVVNTAKIAGGLVGTVSGTATIDACTVSGSVKGSSTVGGIVAYVGTNGSLTITDCTNNANVTSSGIDNKYVYVGGVLGSTQGKVVMSNCENYGTIEQQVAGQFVGGVAGLLRAKTGSSITGCYNYGNIIAPTGAAWVAGVVGCNRIEMTDCYCLNTATITVGTTVNTASALTISGSSSSTVYYLAGTSTSATITGGLCDADGNAITE